MTNDEAVGFLALCNRAAKIAATGKNVDIEDVSQELFVFILRTKAIDSPSYKGLLSILIKEAKGIIIRQRNESIPLGWSPEPWTTEDVRAALRADYSSLPPQLAYALASEQMPQGYRDALDHTYGEGLMPPKGSALRRQMYRAVDRLQATVNYPLEGSGGAVDVHALTDAEDAAITAAAHRETEQRREEYSRDALLGRLYEVR